MKDFGFTFDTEENLSNSADQSILKDIERLLLNLKGDKEMDIIKWPGDKRHKQIDEFLKKLQGLMND